MENNGTKGIDSHNGLISIIVPVYNSEKYLRNCIKSILNQSYTNLEVILVDDGSADSSPIICDEFSEKDERVTVIHKTNEGVSSARNTGLSACNGEYISFIDSDDFIHPYFIEILYCLLLKYDADISQCKSKFVKKYNDAYLSKKTNAFNSELISGNEAALRCVEGKNCLYYCIACVKLFKRSIIINRTYDLITNAEDVKFCFEALFSSDKVAVCDSVLYFYYKHRGSATTSYSALSENIIKVFNEYDDICINSISDKTLLRKYLQGSFTSKIDAVVEDYWIAFNHKDSKRKRIVLNLFSEMLLIACREEYNLTLKIRIFDLNPYIYIFLRMFYRYIYKT